MLAGNVGFAFANGLEEHFFGSKPSCASALTLPTLIVSDATRMGEIDDSISLYMYSRLEKLGCIKVIGIVSIFGNGGSSTSQVHANLKVRLKELNLGAWPVYHGPKRRMPFDAASKVDANDIKMLSEIADVIKINGKVVIAELGPVTVSAILLKSGLIESKEVIKILTVGGRSKGEQFSQNRYLPFAFRDMNVAEDRMAVKYLLDHHPNKVWTVTYKTGVGQRMISPGMVASIGSDELTMHAHKRARKLKTIGYKGLIPSWDTWTTSWFLAGGSERLSCKTTKAKMAFAEHGYKSTDSMQMQLSDQPKTNASKIEACHEILE